MKSEYLQQPDNFTIYTMLCNSMIKDVLVVKYIK